MFLSLLVHVETVADFKEELVKRCYKFRYKLYKWSVISEALYIGLFYEYWIKILLVLLHKLSLLHCIFYQFSYPDYTSI